MITDCHIHIAPLERFRPQALELIKGKRANFDEIAEYCRSPKAFLNAQNFGGGIRQMTLGLKFIF